MRTRSRWLLDITLLALIGLLAAIAYFQPGIEKPKPVPALTTLQPDEVRRMELVYPDERRVVLVREGDQWWLSQPVRMPADRFRAETLVNLVQATSLAQYPVARVDLAKFKLDKPLLEVRFNDLEVAFGDTEPLQSRRYVRVGDAVHLITDQLYSFLNAKPTDLVSHALLPEGVRPVRITLPLLQEQEGAEQPFAGEVTLRFEDSRWVVEPPREGVSQDAVNALVDGWRFAHALEVQPLSEPAKPLGTVTLQLEGDEHPLVFDILEVKPDLVLARRDVGLRYQLAEPLKKRLLQLKAAPSSDTDAGAAGG